MPEAYSFVLFGYFCNYLHMLRDSVCLICKILKEKLIYSVFYLKDLVYSQLKSYNHIGNFVRCQFSDCTQSSCYQVLALILKHQVHIIQLFIKQPKVWFGIMLLDLPSGLRPKQKFSMHPNTNSASSFKNKFHPPYSNQWYLSTKKL